MRSLIGCWLVIGSCLTTISDAEDAREKLIQKDRLQIEGTWRITALEVNGNKAHEADARKLLVVNGHDGTWILLSEGMEISRGTSTIDPTKTPRTIDFTPTKGGGKDNHYQGIYELENQKRRLCFVPPGKERPTEFSSPSDSERILVIFEREKPQQ